MDVNKPRVLDLFAGCGGLSLGFSMAGYETVAAIEFWQPAAETFRFNHPITDLFFGDIREIKNTIFEKYEPGTFSVIVGGPPCQGYSLAGNRNLTDPRGELYQDFYDVVAYFQPKMFVMENVKGLLSMKKLKPNLSPELQEELREISEKIARYKDLKRYSAQRNLTSEESEEYCNLENQKTDLMNRVEEFLVPLKDLILEKIRSIGYQAKYKVLNSVDYGVPQKRERVIFIGSQMRLLLDNVFPIATHKDASVQTLDAFLRKKGKEVEKPWVTVKEAIEDLKDLPENEEFSHVYTKHSQDFIKRLKTVQVGENVYENYSDAWYRLPPDQPARTVKENHGGVFIHYELDRCLTPRELASCNLFLTIFYLKDQKVKF